MKASVASLLPRSNRSIDELGLWLVTLQCNLLDSCSHENAIRLTKKMGASGISIFTANNLDDKQKSVLIKLKKEFEIE